MNKIKEYRADGWPLCPQCEEDELYSLLQWNGDGERPLLADYIAAGLRCYRCWWATPDCFEEDYQAYLIKGRIRKPMTTYEGQTNEQGELLLLDKWANEGNKRVRVWRLAHGDIRIEFADMTKPGEPVYASLSLASYRADDLTKALAKTAT